MCLIMIFKFDNDNVVKVHISYWTVMTQTQLTVSDVLRLYTVTTVESLLHVNINRGIIFYSIVH